MRKPVLSLPAIALGVIALYTPVHADGAGCTTDQCLVNSAISQRVQPTTVTTDDRGDSTFFASQSGQLPNVVFVLDNSTSMYELPYDYNPYPNSAWVNSGQTPDGCGNVSTTPSFGPGCTGTTFAQTTASCHANTFFEGLRDTLGNPYKNTQTYAVPDPAFSAYYTNTNVYKFMEWNTSAPGGVANAGPITFTSGSGATGGTVNGAISTYCAGLDPTPGSGGNGGTGANAWSMSQQQRCQQCIDEAGYYIAPGASTTDKASGQILFKGSWLDFYPPKFIVARKVLTDFISKQSTAPAPVRIGVVTYDPNNVNAINVPSPPSGLQPGDGGHFVSAGMVPDCGVTSWSSASVQTQQTTLLNAVRAISWGTTGSPIATPLAETLFNVGQFFSGDNIYYTNTFGASWLKTEFTAPTGNNKPLCVSCQVNAVVLITDGQPYGDNNLPPPLNANTIQCPPNPPSTADPCGVDEGNSTPNLLDDVTNFLATTDLSAAQPGIQNVITFVIGLGLKRPLLDNAAKYGKTSGAIRANNGDDLQNAVNNAIVNIIARATAFSATAIQTLQVGTGSTAFVPRFLPGTPSDPIWEGHLYRFDLFNEFVAGVDKNGDGTLNDVFMVDKDGDIVVEDDKGAFYKLKNNAPAVPIWDAGAQLAATAPGSRNIYTATYDSTANAWTTIALPSWDGISPVPAAVTTVENYLGIDGTNACAQIKGAMATPIPANYLSSTGVFDRDHCAKAILDYARGFNVLNELSTTTSVTANRLRMLGDIFHSSPVVVDPPVDQFICSLGLHTQCVSTLYQDQLSSALVTPTPSAQYSVTSGGVTKTVDAYEKYWEDHETRQRIVLVGANDGMLHAFDAGLPTTSPPTMSGAGFRQVVYGPGTGNEVWAFIPPDQLSRLWLMMRDGHQISMDGDIMVRDVWVDGQKNDKGTTGYVNQVLTKQDVEYHTVAVAGERQGGNHFVALDVTDTTTPKMLWMYPPPCSADEQQFGETFGQFSPRPPPIGPVLLQTSNTAGQANYGYPHTEERWVTFLNGGHSPFNTRGRAAALVDVYTGQPLFKAAFNPASTDPNDPALQMRFGLSATAAMVDYGRGSSFAQDGFFDTAVLGDEGGQIWTFRFGEPGHWNTTSGLIDNWTFGRAYEPNSVAPNDPRFHLPFYNVAATTVEPDNGWLRAYLGSGDRSHIRSQGGGDCRPDDPMSCLSSGCTLSSSLTLDNGPSHYTSTFASGAGTSAAAPVMASPTQAQSTVAANACNYGNASETITVSACPNTAMNFTEPLTFTCTGSPLACTDGAFKQPTPNTNRALATTSPSPTAPNSFVSVAVLADATGSPSRVRRMNLPADADTYDQNRLTGCGNAACAANTPSAGLTGDLVDVSATTATTSTVSGNQAGRSSAGWTVRYGIIDEKTATSSTILGGCVIWNSLQPTGGAVGCASTGSSVAVFYQSDAVTGAPNCAVSFLSGTSYSRSISRNVLSPPPEPTAAISVGSGGTALRYSTLEIQPGSQQVTQMTVGTSTEMLQMLYSIPVSIDQHTCRHVDATTCE